MGANHFSHSVFGTEPAEVRTALVRWLRAKGYDLQDGSPLTPLDPKRERGLALAWNRDRVVVLYSDMMELPRLLFELKKLGTVLDYWMHDSDIWGYQLWKEGAVVDAFHSDPTYFGGFEDIEGPRDLDALCAALGLGDRADELAALQQRKQTFAEGVSSAFVEALGVGPAAAQYGYMADLGWPGEGFEVEYLWFRQEGWDPMTGWTVDRVRFEVYDPATAWQADLSPEQVAQMEAQARRGQWIARAMGFLMWPFFQVMRLWWWWRMRRIRAEAEAAVAGLDLAARPDPFADREPDFEVDGRTLRHPRHQCTLELPEGATADRAHQIAIGPGAVFRFAVGEGFVAIQALPPSTVEQMGRMGPADSVLEEDRFETADGRPVRWLEHRWKSPHQQGPERMWRVFGIVAGPHAVYQLSASAEDPPPPELVAACRQALESLRFDEG